MANQSSAANLNLEEFNRLTLTQMDKEKVWSSVFHQTPTLDAMRKNGMIQTDKPLGKGIEWTVEKEDLPGGAWVSRGYVHTLEVKDIHEIAQLTTKRFESMLALYIEDIENNELVDKTLVIARLVAEQLKNKIRKMADQINTAIWNDGTDTLSIIGWQKVAATSRLYAALNSTSNTWWDPMVYSSDMAQLTATHLKDPASAYNIRAFLNHCLAILQQQEFNISDYMIFCTHGFANIYRDYVHNYLNVNTTDGKLGTVDLGSGDLRFQGLPLIADSDVPYTDASGGNSWVLFVPKESTRLICGKVMEGVGKDSGGQGLFAFSGWGDNRSMGQSSLSGMLTLRAVFPNKVPGRILKAHVDGDTVNTISTT